MCDFGVGSGTATASAASSAYSAYAAAAATALLTAASTAATMYAQDQSNKAVNKQYNEYDNQMAQQIEAERQRQNALTEKNRSVFNDNLTANDAAKVAAQQAAEAEALGKKYTQPASAAAQEMIPGADTAAQPTGQTGNRVVMDDYRKQLQGVGKYLTGQGNALGNLDAFKNTMLAQGMQTGRFSDMLNMNNQFGRSSMGVLGLEQQALNSGAEGKINAAAGAGQNMAALGGLLNSGAQIAGQYASSGTAPTMFEKGSKTSAGAVKKAAPYAAGVSRTGIGSYYPVPSRA